MIRMIHHRGWTAIGFALACAACGSAAAPAIAAPIEACSVLTLDEIKSAIGRGDFSRGKPDDGGTKCRYASGRGSLSVWLSATTKASFDDFRNLLTEQGKKPEAVAGVGDDAYFWDDRLYVRVGNRGLTIDLNKNGLAPEPSASIRAKVLALAKAAVPKLR